ncbi:MAG: hypothetical protein ACYCZ7_02235 [Minisyncoccota bacterium]
MPKRLYFGHPVNAYEKEIEDPLLQQISEAFHDWEIENPNQEHHADGYEHYKRSTRNGMRYYTEVVLPSCCGGIFLPFRDGAWGAGVFTEAKFFTERNLPVWMITIDGAIIGLNLSTIQPLSVEETQARIRTVSGETIPY